MQAVQLQLKKMVKADSETSAVEEKDKHRSPLADVGHGSNVQRVQAVDGKRPITSDKCMPRVGGESTTEADLDGLSDAEFDAILQPPVAKAAQQKRKAASTTIQTNTKKQQVLSKRAAKAPPSKHPKGKGELLLFHQRARRSI